MNIIGIVCEYDPFHLGHLYQLRESRRLLGEDSAVVCVMSGDFVQRGEPALWSKYARAEAACRCGADLVLELPVQWALSSAEGFARGAVAILTAAGCSHISFGSEEGSVEGMKQLAELLLDEGTIEGIKGLMKLRPQLSFPAARQAYIEEKHGELGRLLQRPNDILGLEYIKAIIAQNSPMQPITVQRRGSGHDQPGLEGFASASQLRSLLAEGRDISPWLPAEVSEILEREGDSGRMVDMERWELALLSRLRMLNEDSYLSLPDSEDGTGARIYSAVRSSVSFEEILAQAKTKRVPQARLRRMLCQAALGISSGQNRELPPYARVLAIGCQGRDVLRRSDKDNVIKPLTKPARVGQISERAERVFACGAYAHDLFCLLYSAKNQRMVGEDWRKGPVLVDI